jgi:hypothetical protein
MSIRREQEHDSLALTAAVSVLRRIGSLQKRRHNERLQTSLYDLWIFLFGCFLCFILSYIVRRLIDPTNAQPDATRK